MFSHKTRGMFFLVTLTCFLRLQSTKAGITDVEPSVKFVNMEILGGARCGPLTGGQLSHLNVGKFCTNFTSTNENEEIDVMTITIYTRFGLSEVRFGNMPIVWRAPAEAGGGAKPPPRKRSQTLELRIDEIEEFLCDASDDTYQAIQGEVMTEKMQVVSVENGVKRKVRRKYLDYFEVPVKCLGPAKTKERQEEVSAVARGIRNFHLHIPKAGGHTHKLISRYLLGELLATEKGGRKVVCETVPAHDIFMDPTGETWDDFVATNGCVLVTAERGYNAQPAIPVNRIFTILRDPVEHVLSQYFHCKESREQMLRLNGVITAGAFVVPDKLDDWLQEWVGFHKKGGTNPTHFNCFNPINMQSSFLGYPTKDELRTRYETVGLTSRLETSSCIEIITLMGRVPPSCNCTNAPTSNDNKGIVEPAKRTRRKLSGVPIATGLYGVHEDHNVTHHGSTFKVTRGQWARIKALTNKDRELYAEARTLFAENVKRVEEEYDMRLC